METIYAISLTKLSLNFTTSFSMVPHELNIILTDLEEEYLVSRVLTEDAISNVSHYDFNMEKLTVHLKHATLPNNENQSKGIVGLESI